MRLGAILPQTEIGPDPADLAKFASAVEAGGLQFLDVYEHVVGADRAARPDWDGPYDLDSQFHEPLVLFGFLAAHTTLELSTSVLVLPQRQTTLRYREMARLQPRGPHGCLLWKAALRRPSRRVRPCGVGTPDHAGRNVLVLSGLLEHAGLDESRDFVRRCDPPTPRRCHACARRGAGPGSWAYSAAAHRRDPRSGRGRVGSLTRGSR